jgi:hypothetical protein
MDINCPYCGAHYELDDSLLPEGDIKVKCRVCSNVFILNKNSGAFKDEPQVSAEAQTPVHSSPQAQTSGSAPASFDSSKHPVSDDFMQSIMSEINSAVAEEASGKNKKDSGSALFPRRPLHLPLHPAERVRKATMFQIIMLIILAVLFLIAAASALVHYNIINIPFLPSGVAAFLSSF